MILDRPGFVGVPCGMSDEPLSILKTILSSERFAYDYSRSWRFLAATPTEHRKLLELLGLPTPQPKIKAKVARLPDAPLDLGELVLDEATESLVPEVEEGPADV